MTLTQDGMAWVNDPDFLLSSVTNTRKAIRIFNPDVTESALSFGTGGWPQRYQPGVFDYSVGSARMANGNIIITSQTPELLKEHRVDGTFVRNIYLHQPAGTAYAGDPGYRSPYAVAVDPADGTLLVGYIDPGTGNSGFIERIDPDACTTETITNPAGAVRDRCTVLDTIGVGTFPNGNGSSGTSAAVTFSIQVDPTTQDVYVAARSGLAYVFGQDGTPKGRFSAFGTGAGNGQISSAIRGIAFDERGFLYATVGEGTAATRVEIFARTPDPITELTAAYTSTSLTEATLAWDALPTGVTDDAQTPLRDYVVEQSIDGGTTWSVVPTPVTTSTGATVTGLDPVLAYQFRVSAWNEAGNGDTAVVPLLAPEPGGFTVTKTVTGSPEAITLVGDTAFEVTYAVDGVPAAQPLTIADGEIATVGDLPAGAVVTLQETPAAAPGVTFGTPRFLVDGVESTSLTITADEIVAVVLENPAEVVPPALGGFSLTKTVTGSPAAIAAVGPTDFEVTYTVDGVPAAQPLLVAHGETVSVVDLPAGADVTLAESPTPVAGVTFGAPRFVVDGIETTTLTVVEGVAATVVLENPAEIVPPTPGAIEISKVVSGPQAAIDAVGQTAFEVTYSVDGTPAAQSVVIRHRGTVTLGELPAGAVVALAETPASATGVTFGAPIFSVDGVATSSVTIVAGETVEVILENPATLTASGSPTGPPTATPTTSSPTATPPATPPSSPAATTPGPHPATTSAAPGGTARTTAAGTLPRTGASSLGYVAGAGAILLAVGTVVLVLRRRTAELTE
ncbi:hypothetical protein C8046_02020 [Serinibacter arcticus]|uniref:Fibronectin type-III domain-containing protein n=1 Tax=Serinibacter arcticus TaxID=1655435 RepID=A0A2U1ZRR5_9MICO|nr:DUF5979 domain-containing protein [Serinibacter arcticus]PWD49667.1 hypothetical protein C8046_02020 [Serinibacter arcticus]